jgi:hypothetical protein
LVGIAVTVEENPVQKDTEFMSRDLFYSFTWSGPSGVMTAPDNGA